MNVYQYPKELNAALIYKKEGKTFEEYEAAAQNLLQPIECQIFWLLAEDVMNIVEEEVNKETAEAGKMLGEKEREIAKLKTRLNKMSGGLDISDDEEFEENAIGRVFVTVIKDNIISDVIESKTYDEKSKTVSGKGLITKIEKSETLGDWFIVKDLDTGSKKAYRLNNVEGYTELRYPMVTECSPVPEDLQNAKWAELYDEAIKTIKSDKGFDPDKRVEPSVTEICGYSDAHFNGEYHGEEQNPSNYGENGGGF